MRSSSVKPVTSCFFAALFVAASSASGLEAEATTYFPLDAGNRWTYIDADGDRQMVATVSSREDSIVTYEIGGREVRLLDNGSEIDIELPVVGFVPYYLFEEESWFHRDVVDCDDNRIMEVLSRDATVTTRAGTFQNCIDIAYATGGCLDSGSFREWWAPDVGRVKWVEVRFDGVVTWELQSFEQAEHRNPFRRGDANQDDRADLSDAVYVLNFLFFGGATPACMKSIDNDDSGNLNISDAVVLLNHLFLGGPPPSDPFDRCGADPTADALGCESYSPCE